MDILLDTLMARPALTLGVSTFLSGAALLYLVIQRTRKRHIENAGKAEG